MTALTAPPLTGQAQAWDAGVFVHLVRIALPMSTLSSRARREVSVDLSWLAQENDRREPRAHVVDLLTTEVLDRLLPALDADTADTLQAGRPARLTAA